MMISRKPGPCLKVVTEADPEPGFAPRDPLLSSSSDRIGERRRPANETAVDDSASNDWASNDWASNDPAANDRAGGDRPEDGGAPMLELTDDGVGDAFFDAWRRAFGQLEAQYSKALTERQHAFEAERGRVEAAYRDAMTTARSRHQRERATMEQMQQAEIEALEQAYRAALEHLERRRRQEVASLKTGLQTDLKAYGDGASTVIRRIGEGRLPVRYLKRALSGLLQGASPKR